MSAPTVLGPNGEDLLQDRDQWLVETLYSWLQDRELVSALVADGVPSDGILTIYRNLQNHIKTMTPYTRVPLRREVLTCLRSKGARPHIYRLSVEANLAEHEAEMDEWAKRTSLWLSSKPGAWVGNPPEMPPPVAQAKQVRRDIQALMDELEEFFAEEKVRSETLVVL